MSTTILNDTTVLNDYQGTTCPYFINQHSKQQHLKKIASFFQIKTHGSESRGQEEAGLRDERVSYLQVAPL